MLKLKYLVLILLILFVFTEISSGTVINVPADYEQIPEAIADANHGDTIIVAQGQYNGNVNFNGKRIVLASTFILSGNTDDIDATIIRGQGTPAVTMNHNENSQTQLIGFTLRSGQASYGGGLFLDNVSPRIENCYFTGNVVANHGGGTKIYRGSPIFDDCIFVDNTAERDGGAVYVDRGVATFNNCEFRNNTADLYGGAIKVFEGILHVNDTEFFGNYAGSGGGAVRGCERPTETYFEHCTFIANSAGGDGGGALLMLDSGTHRVNFCTFFANTADDISKSAIYAHNQADLTLKNSIVWGNGDGDGDAATISGDITVSYSDIEYHEDFPGNGNFTADPLFVDIEDENEGGGGDDPQNESTFNFTAGQHIDVGDVRVYQEEGDNDVYVEITMAEDWVLNESHIEWGYSIDDIPHNNGGPIPGQFTYKEEHDGVSEYTCRLDINDEGFTGVFVVHGAVQGNSNETAWGGSEEYPGNNWALYFEYNVGNFDGGNEGRENPYDVHLTENSPCIDVGDPAEDEDPDATRADIGAYYFDQPPEHEDGTMITVPEDYGTIQAAINASSDGDTIIVSRGTYEENINFNGKIITVCSRYFLTRDIADIENTIITGADGNSVVIFENGETSSTKLCGFTITNENATYTRGGGIYIVDSSPTIQWIFIHGIRQDDENHQAGAVSCLNSESIFRFCRFWDNEGRDGGGVYSSNSTLTFYWCLIYENTAINGGGFLFTNSQFTFTYCLIWGNMAEYGGGFYFAGCTGNFVNCTVSENEAEEGGGGVYIDTNVEFDILNNIFWGNSPDEFNCNPDGEGIMITANWNCVEGGREGVVNRRVCNLDYWTVWNIQNDPLFVDQENDDFHLSEDSPCIDQGHPNSDTDPDGTRRDMGALYFERDNIHVQYYYGGGWYMISMGVLPYINDVESVFWDDLTRSYWVFKFAYDVGFSVPEEGLEPGPGYFFGTEDTLIYLDILGEEIEDTVYYDLQIPWNLVGTPFLSTISLYDVLFHRDNETIDGEEAINRGWIGSTMQCWRHEWFEYREFTWFYPWYGYWMYCLEPDVQMIIPPPEDNPDPIPPSPGRDGGDEFAPDSWHANLDFDLGENSYRVRFGVAESATDGWDNRYDTPETIPPPDGFPIKAYFYHDDWQQDLGVRWSKDFRQPFEYEQTKEWELTVETEEGGEVTISWATLQFTVPEDFNLYLIDNETEQQIDMLGIESYTYNTEDTLRSFTIRTQSMNDVDDPGLALLPLAYAISGIYPNPFNAITKVEFSLPHADRVFIGVFDISGRMVSSLVDSRQQAGIHTVSWDAKNSSAGVYFIKMGAGGHTFMQKVVLVK